LQQVDCHIVSKLLLRKGDFIEDRFGQAQRNLLASLKDQPELLLRTHQWFGSYLLYSLSGEGEVRNIEGEEVKEEVEREEKERLDRQGEGMGSLSKSQEPNPFLFSSSCIMVSHLRGRHYDPYRVAWPEARTKQVEIGGERSSSCSLEAVSCSDERTPIERMTTSLDGTVESL
jgi:hypothetical protein